MLRATLSHVDPSVSNVNLGVKDLATFRAYAPGQLDENGVSLADGLQRQGWVGMT